MIQFLEKFRKIMPWIILGTCLGLSLTLGIGYLGFHIEPVKVGIFFTWFLLMFVGVIAFILAVAIIAFLLWFIFRQPSFIKKVLGFIVLIIIIPVLVYMVVGILGALFGGYPVFDFIAFLEWLIYGPKA